MAEPGRVATRCSDRLDAQRAIDLVDAHARIHRLNLTVTCKETARNPEILQLGSPYYLNPVLPNTFRVISYGK